MSFYLIGFRVAEEASASEGRTSCDVGLCLKDERQKSGRSIEVIESGSDAIFANSPSVASEASPKIQRLLNA